MCVYIYTSRHICKNINIKNDEFIACTCSYTDNFNRVCCHWKF